MIDGCLLSNNRPIVALIRVAFPTRAMANKGKALTTDLQHPTEIGLPMVQISGDQGKSFCMSYIALWFVICMNLIAWSCRSYEFDVAL